MPQLKDALHPPTAQVQVAILQADRLIDLGLLIDRKRRSASGVQDVEALDLDLDLAGRHIRIVHTAGPAADDPLHLQDPLHAHALGRPVRLGGVRGVGDHLDNPAPVAHVQEREAAMVAPSVDPAGESHALAGMGGTQLPASVCLVHDFSP